MQCPILQFDQQYREKTGSIKYKRIGILKIIILMNVLNTNDDLLQICVNFRYLCLELKIIWPRTNLDGPVLVVSGSSA